MANALPPGIALRPAVQADEGSIRALIRSEHLNPIGLDWRNFLVAADSTGKIAAIGAVKKHGDGSRELASIATVPAWRGKGLAGTVIRAILERQAPADAGKPLYLTCRRPMKGFYEPFGFVEIRVDEMTPYFRRLYRLIAGMSKLMGRENQLTVMRCD